MELKLLPEIATTQPHAAFAAYRCGMTSKWLYLNLTIPSIGHHLKVLDDILRSDLIPNITSRPPSNDVEMKLMALPARLSGLGIGSYTFSELR